jgi:hypothetical protein
MGGKPKKHKNIHLYAGHQFKVVTFFHPTFCAHCEGFIWGVRKQGWQCTVCSMTLHKNVGGTGNPVCCSELSKFCKGVKPGQIKKIAKKMSKKGRESGWQSKGGTFRKGSSTAHLEVVHQDEDDDDDDEDDEDDDGDGDGESAFGRRRGRSFFVSMALPPDPSTEPKTFQKYVAADNLKILKSMQGKNTGKEIKRQELIYELIQLEKGYYRHLVIMKKFFKIPFESPVGTKLLSTAELSTLFGNIEVLIEAHRSVTYFAPCLHTTLLTAGTGTCAEMPREKGVWTNLCAEMQGSSSCIAGARYASCIAWERHTSGRVVVVSV